MLVCWTADLIDGGFGEAANPRSGNAAQHARHSIGKPRTRSGQVHYRLPWRPATHTRRLRSKQVPTSSLLQRR